LQHHHYITAQRQQNQLTTIYTHSTLLSSLTTQLHNIC